MRITFQIIRTLIWAALAPSCLASSAFAQEVIIPDPALNAVIRETLSKPNGPLTQSDLLALTNLTAITRGITNLQGLAAAHHLQTLVLDDNRINSLSSNDLANFPSLTLLDLSENPLRSLVLPAGLTNLIHLRLENGSLTNFRLPAGLIKFTELRLGFNQLSSLTLPPDLTSLSALSIYQNQLTNLVLPPSLTNLSELDVDGNHLARLQLPAGLTKLSFLAVGANQLTNFTLPPGMTNLSSLRLNDNQLTDLVLPAGLGQLGFLHLPGNQLHRLVLPAGLTNLAFLILNGNPLTNLTLPPDVTQLSTFFFGDTPLATLVLSEPLAASGLAGVVDSLRGQGVAVFTYPLAVQLLQPRALGGVFVLDFAGPPGTYSLLGSTDLVVWSEVGLTTNTLGRSVFQDAAFGLSLRKFYRAHR